MCFHSIVFADKFPNQSPNVTYESAHQSANVTYESAHQSANDTYESAHQSANVFANQSADQCTNVTNELSNSNSLSARR
mgnify:CR=1 FL=1